MPTEEADRSSSLPPTLPDSKAREATWTWIKNISGVVGLVSAVAAIILNFVTTQHKAALEIQTLNQKSALDMRTLQQKADLDHDTAVLNLKSEAEKVRIAEEQMRFQNAQHREDGQLDLEKHRADIDRLQKADATKQADDENARVAQLITGLFTTSKGSEGALAVLSTYAAENNRQKDAIANALLAKLGTTESLGDVSIAFRLIEHLGTETLPLVTDINRSARRRYDEAIRKQYLRAVGEHIIANKQEGLKGGFHTSNMLLEATSEAVRQFGPNFYVIGTVNEIGFRGPLFINNHSADYDYEQAYEAFVAPSDPEAIKNQLRVAKEILDLSIVAIGHDLNNRSTYTQAVDLHGCFLEGMAWPSTATSNVVFSDAWLGPRVSNTYRLVNFDAETSSSFLQALSIRVVNGGMGAAEDGMNFPGQNLYSTFLTLREMQWPAGQNLNK